MVSSALDVSLEDLLGALRRIRRERAEDPDYREWRKEFPKSWPV